MKSRRHSGAVWRRKIGEGKKVTPVVTEYEDAKTSKQKERTEVLN